MESAATLVELTLITFTMSFGYFFVHTYDDLLKMASEIALCHHEKWDGSGYPEGLGGDAIPLSARLMAVADVYDALISRRVYKPAFTHEVALDIIEKGRGSHFDPAITDAFMAIHPQFKAVAEKHRCPEDL